MPDSVPREPNRPAEPLLDEAYIQKLRDYFLFTTQDEQALSSFAAQASQHVVPFLDRLYAHFLSFEDTRKFFPDQATMERARAAQRRYFLSLFSGPWDQQRWQMVWHLGRVHDKIGLEPRWYMGAYALYLANTIPLLIREREAGNISQACSLAFAKLVMMDAALAWESYYQHRQARLTQAYLDLERRQRELQATHNLAMQALNERAGHIERLQEISRTIESGLMEMQSLLSQYGEMVKQAPAPQYVDLYLKASELVRRMHELLTQRP